jgi:hypothetical protein
MVLLVDVPSSWAHPRGIGQMNSPIVVFEQFAVDNWCGLGKINSMFLHLLEKVHHNNGNTETPRETNIFTLSGG